MQEDESDLSPMKSHIAFLSLGRWEKPTDRVPQVTHHRIKVYALALLNGPSVNSQQ